MTLYCSNKFSAHVLNSYMSRGESLNSYIDPYYDFISQRRSYHSKDQWKAADRNRKMINGKTKLDLYKYIKNLSIILELDVNIEKIYKENKNLFEIILIEIFNTKNLDSTSLSAFYDNKRYIFSNRYNIEENLYNIIATFIWNWEFSFEILNNSSEYYKFSPIVDSKPSQSPAIKFIHDALSNDINTTTKNKISYTNIVEKLRFLEVKDEQNLKEKISLIKNDKIIITFNFLNDFSKSEIINIKSNSNLFFESFRSLITSAIMFHIDNLYSRSDKEYYLKIQKTLWNSWDEIANNAHKEAKLALDQLRSENKSLLRFT